MVESVNSFLQSEKAAYQHLAVENKVQQNENVAKKEAKKPDEAKRAEVAKGLSSAIVMFEMALASRDDETMKMQEGQATQIENDTRYINQASAQQKQISQNMKTLSSDKSVSSEGLNDGILRGQVDMAAAANVENVGEMKMQVNQFNIKNESSMQGAIAGMANILNNLEIQFGRNVSG